MNIIATADWHLSKSTPISRTDPDYFQTGLDKIQQVANYARKYKAVICVAGDIFDNLRVTPYMINKVYEALQGIFVFSVAGQHDMEYRNITEACAYSTLVELSCIRHLSKNNRTYDNVLFSGVSFNEDVPRSLYSDVVLVHKTITENDPPFFLKDAVKSSSIMKLLKECRIIISGDYHVPFVKKKYNQVLVNCGSLMRRGKDQMDYKPCVWLIDTDTLAVKALPLAIKPVKEVFSFAVRNEDAQNTQQKFILADMDKVIERLTREELKPSFENILLALAEEEKLSDIEKEIMKEILEVAKSGTDKEVL